MAKIGGPIPGQSWTAEPGKYAWQKPPKYNRPEEALQYYLQKFNDPEVLDDLLMTLDYGYPIRAFVEAMTTIGVMKGLHTVDVSLIIMPLLHEYIKGIATTAKIDFEEGLYLDAKKAEKEKLRAKVRLQKALSKVKSPDAGTEMVKDVMASGELDLEASEMPQEAPQEAAPMEAPTEEPMPPVEAPMASAGLMARKV